MYVLFRDVWLHSCTLCLKTFEESEHPATCWMPNVPVDLQTLDDKPFIHTEQMTHLT